MLEWVPKIQWLFRFFPVDFVLKDHLSYAHHGCHSPQFALLITRVRESVLHSSHEPVFQKGNIRGRLVGLPIAPVTAVGLGALHGTHRLPPLLSILDFPHPQPAALKVLVTYLWCDPNPHPEWSRVVSASDERHL